MRKTATTPLARVESRSLAKIGFWSFGLKIERGRPKPVRAIKKQATRPALPAVLKFKRRRALGRAPPFFSQLRGTNPAEVNHREPNTRSTSFSLAESKKRPAIFWEAAVLGGGDDGQPLGMFHALPVAYFHASRRALRQPLLTKTNANRAPGFKAENSSPGVSVASVVAFTDESGFTVAALAATSASRSRSTVARHSLSKIVPR